MLSSCPFCNEKVLQSELEWHANNHFAEDELEVDMELAKQLALAPPSPRSMNITTTYVELAPITQGRVSVDSVSSSNYGSLSGQDIKDQALVTLQSKSSFYKVEGGLMSLLRRCLELDSTNLVSFITGDVEHYQSLNSEDSGWGCGWRNVQMLSSHLLMQREDARNLLFGGSGFVPDIQSLQRWLENAWARGFDTDGARAFNSRVYASKKWIGTTECATLFRSFGFRARVVDFDSLRSPSTRTSDALKKCRKQGGITRTSKAEHVNGPMEKFLQRVEHGSCKVDSSLCAIPNKEKQRSSGQQVLMDWIWNYFSGASNYGNDSQCVYVSERTPLYFQHHGHSRTIAGIQLRKGTHRLEDQYFLLVLDPAQSTSVLEGSLRENNGWQKLIKRGVHTLKKPQYQLCYVDPGIACEEEIEQLKIMDSILVEF